MKIVFTVLLLISTIVSYAQDKKTEPKKGSYKVSTTVKSVRSLLKEKKYSNANDEINKAFNEHESARSSAQLYSFQTYALQNLILDENRKMYLNQKPDTSKYFSYIYSLYTSALRCDSIDQLPNEKGKVDIKYRDSNRSKLLQFRKNLSKAGTYFYQKNEYQNAYRFEDLYLSTKDSPIFTDSKGNYTLSDETDSVEHSSLAVFLAYACGNNDGVIKYIPVALNDTSRLAQLLEVGSKAYCSVGDTISSNNLLYKGLQDFPTTEYFYLTLVKYFNDRGEYNNALNIIDSVLVYMPDNRNALFLKAKEHEYLSEYEKALETLDNLVSINNNDAEAYSQIGSINLMLAHKAYDNFNLKVTDRGYSKGRQFINSFYKNSKTAFESCRKYAEDNPELWLSGLRECYYKLNMGKELKLLEKF